MTVALENSQPLTQPQLPALAARLDDYTNGSSKIFGLENFGNTCYCNSILQCLYYSKPFREHILAFPEDKLLSATDVPKFKDSRPRRTSVPGLTPHPFTVNPNTAQLNTSTGAPDTSNVPPPAAANVNGEKKGFFGWGGKKDASGDNESDEHSEEESAIAPTDPATVARIQALAEGLQGLSLGMRFPGQNLPVVGFTDDPFATQEARKRAALVKGPIINQDQSHSSEYNMPETLFTSLKDVFESMAENSSRTGVVSPSKLIEVLKRENELFRASMHQDAHEFFNFLLNEVIENVDQYNGQLKKTGSRWVHDLFEGLLTSETKCLTCETVSRRDEQFLDLSIDLERNSSITSCLQQFSASEMLCEGNKFHCDTCGGLQEAEKRMKVKQLPKLLTLHLKRFKYTEDMQRNVKLFHRVLYPKHIRLMNTTYDAEDPDRLYELCAVVVHIGGGPYHGHYVSVVKTELCGWLLFDDEMVESVDPSYVFNFFGDNKGMATAYVLFYQQTTQAVLEGENLYTNEELQVPVADLTTSAGPPVINPPVVANVPAQNGVTNGGGSVSNGNKQPVPYRIDEQSDRVGTATADPNNTVPPTAAIPIPNSTVTPFNPFSVVNGNSNLNSNSNGVSRGPDLVEGNGGSSFGSKFVSRTKSKNAPATDSGDGSKRSRVFSFSRRNK